MLDNSSSDSLAPAASIATVKRYAPPNQRNRSLGRRKSGGGLKLRISQVDSTGGVVFYSYADRLERANSYMNDGVRNPIAATKSGPIADHGESALNNRVNESLHARLIRLHGCYTSEASQLLNNRWAAAINALNSLPDDSAEKPVVYSRKGVSTWEQAIHPHLPTGGVSAGLLRQAMQSTNSGP